MPSPETRKCSGPDSEKPSAFVGQRQTGPEQRSRKQKIIRLDIQKLV